MVCAEALYTTAAAWAADLGEGAEVWDLFCGVGGFALALVGGGRRVLGVEVSAPRRGWPSCRCTPT